MANDIKLTRARVSRYNNYLKAVIKPLKFTGPPISGAYPGIVLTKSSGSTFSLNSVSGPMYSVRYISPDNAGFIDAEWWNPNFSATIPENTTCTVFIIVDNKGKQRFYFTIAQFTSLSKTGE